MSSEILLARSVLSSPVLSFKASRCASNTALSEENFALIVVASVRGDDSCGGGGGGGDGASSSSSGGIVTMLLLLLLSSRPRFSGRCGGSGGGGRATREVATTVVGLALAARRLLPHIGYDFRRTREDVDDGDADDGDADDTIIDGRRSNFSKISSAGCVL